MRISVLSSDVCSSDLGANGHVVDDLDADNTVLKADEEGPSADNPLVVAETRVDIPEASLSDAVMMLDLRNTTALLFRNSGTGSFNMVYRREDGNIGWVEPQRVDRKSTRLNSSH